MAPRTVPLDLAVARELWIETSQNLDYFADQLRAEAAIAEATSALLTAAAAAERGVQRRTSVAFPHDRVLPADVGRLGDMLAQVRRLAAEAHELADGRRREANRRLALLPREFAERAEAAELALGATSDRARQSRRFATMARRSAEKRGRGRPSRVAHFIRLMLERNPRFTREPGAWVDLDDELRFLGGPGKTTALRDPRRRELAQLLARIGVKIRPARK